MTTIVATRDALYSDSRITIGITTVHGPKLYRRGDAIIATAGDCSAGNMFLDWYGTGNPKPKLRKKQDMDVLLVTKAGIFHYDKDFEAVEITDPYFAIGSGGDLALMAMRYYGASPEDAVRAAMSTDINSGGEVQVLRLLQGRAKSAKTSAGH